MTKKCKDSPTGKHEWIVDVEYDRDNPPTVCDHCGERKPPRKKKNKPAVQYFLVGWNKLKLSWDVLWYGITATEADIAFKDLSIVYSGRRKRELRLFKGTLRKIRY